jgi:hypothetical protein
MSHTFSTGGKSNSFDLVARLEGLCVVVVVVVVVVVIVSSSVQQSVKALSNGTPSPKPSQAFCVLALSRPN